MLTGPVGRDRREGDAQLTKGTVTMDGRKNVLWSRLVRVGVLALLSRVQ